MEGTAESVERCPVNRVAWRVGTSVSLCTEVIPSRKHSQAPKSFGTSTGNLWLVLDLQGVRVKGITLGPHFSGENMRANFPALYEPYTVI